jgi:hypothetical protein
MRFPSGFNLDEDGFSYLSSGDFATGEAVPLMEPGLTKACRAAVMPTPPGRLKQPVGGFPQRHRALREGRRDPGWTSPVSAFPDQNFLSRLTGFFKERNLCSQPGSPAGSHQAARTGADNDHALFIVFLIFSTAHCPPDSLPSMTPFNRHLQPDGGRLIVSKDRIGNTKRKGWSRQFPDTLFAVSPEFIKPFLTKMPDFKSK